MKKTEKIQIGAAFGVLVICFLIFLWNTILFEVLPWKKTHFLNYQKYLELLVENRCLGKMYFVQEVPSSTDEVEYYWYRNWAQKYAAHSITLTEAEYEKIAEERLASYYEKFNGNMDNFLYMQQEGERTFCYIDETDLFVDDLEFVKSVLHNPDAQQQYYFLVLIDHEVGDNMLWYHGVVLNDVTYELVEFSAEVGKEKIIGEEEYEKKKKQQKEDVALVFIVLGGAFLLVYAMKVIDKKLDKNS